MDSHQPAPVVVIHAAGVSARKVRQIVTEAITSATATIISTLGGIMADMRDLESKIDQLEAGQVEMAKDVRRLLTQGDTSSAIARLDAVIGDEAALDTEVEAASPEPTATSVSE